MQFFRALTQIKPTSAGLKYVKTAEFATCCHQIAHDMLAAGKTWNDVDVQLRYTATVAIMPRREYDADDITNFYTRHFTVIDAAWLSTVITLKKEYMEMQKDPKQWLRAHGLFPAAPTGL
jgi:hypothetical protein